MKKTLLLLLITIYGYGQTGILTPVDRLRIKTPQELSSNTQVITRGTATGETGYVLKSDLTDVLKYATASAFPLTGVVGKLYYAIDTDLYYKWDGATYEEFGAGGTETDPLALKIASNLGDLSNVSTARTNLGLGTLATQNGTFTDKEDVSNKENTTLDTSTTKYPTNNLVKSSIDARVSQYKTYFINTATGNNATGVYEDASKPFQSIDYVLGLGTYAGGVIFLQNAGTFALNGTIPDFDISIKSDQSCTLDFSSNSNTNLIPTASTTKNYEINLPFGIVINEKSGASGSTFNSLGTGNIIFKAKELYSNQSNNFINYFASTIFEVEKVSGRESVLATVDTSTQKSCNDIEIKNFVCLASNSCLISGAGSTVSMSIGLISGTGNYRFSGGRYNIGNITTTGTTSNGSTSSNFLYLNFKNSTITSSGGIELGNRNTSTTGVVITGNIASCPLIFATAVTNVAYNSYLTKFINFSANFGTGTYNQNHGNVIFENCSIKSTNSPITLGGGTAYNSSVEIKNSTFEVVNSVPLITGGASSVDTVKVAGLSTNATMLSDQSGTGVTVNVIGKQSVATAVNPNDAVTKAQLDSAIIGGGGGADLSTTYTPTTVTIVSSSGTDATVNAVDGTNAGVVTPTQKADWDAKQTEAQVLSRIDDAIQDSPYDATGWDGVTEDAPSMNSVRDKFVLVDSAISSKYDASNPIGYQTASQVQAIADAKVSDTAYNVTSWNGVTDIAPTQNSLRDKFVSLESDIASSLNTKANNPTFDPTQPTIALIDDAGAIVYAETGTFPTPVELVYVKGVTSAIQPQLDNKQPLSAVLTATTASFTTADETKLDKYPSTATNGKILQGNGTNYVEVDAPTSPTTIVGITGTKAQYDTSVTDGNFMYVGDAPTAHTHTSSDITDFNSATRAQVEAELVAGSNITITPSGTGATRQLTIASTGGGATNLDGLSDVTITTPSTNEVLKYNGTEWVNGSPSNTVKATYTDAIVVTATTAPTGATNHSYCYEDAGGFVDFKLNIDFATAGSSVTSIACELPFGAPVPSLPSGVGAVGDVITYGTGTMTANRALGGAMGVCALRLKSVSPNVFEVVVTRTAASYSKAYYSISYAK